MDYAFRQFFDSCKNTPWFKNTLFVFCADHWLNPDYTAEWSQVHCSSIPIFIFDPSDPSGRNDPVVAGQVDIIPTILDKLNYNGNYTGFGKSLLDTSFKERYMVNRLNYIHQVISDGFVLGYNEPLEKVQYFYHYAADSLLKHDLADNPANETKKERLQNIIRPISSNTTTAC